MVQDTNLLNFIIALVGVIGTGVGIAASLIPIELFLGFWPLAEMLIKNGMSGVIHAQEKQNYPTLDQYEKL